MFPDFFKPLCQVGVVGQALQGVRAHLSLQTVLISDYSTKGFKGVDDAPYGGGSGMVMRADVLKEAFLKGVVQEGRYGEHWREKLRVVYPAPRGKVWCDQMAKEKAVSWFQGEQDLVFLCGRYEGVDERFLENYVDEFISLGDFVLSGAEVAVMAYLDSCLRFLPGVLGNPASHEEESHSEGILEYPHYTRPAEFEGLKVPPVLLSGHHRQIGEYRRREGGRDDSPASTGFSGKEK